MTDVLMPQARRLLAKVGQVPTRNEIMGHFKISGPKASAIRDELIREDAVAVAATPAAPRRRPRGARQLLPSRRLRRVGTNPVEAPAPVVVVPSVEVHVPAPAAPRWRPTDAHPARFPRRARKVGTTVVEPLSEVKAESVVLPHVTAPEATPNEVAELAPHSGHQAAPPARKPPRAWPVLVLALPASVAIWAGWVGIGGLTGFGEINLLPGIVEDSKWSTINSAITLPIGMEAYAAYALRVWLSTAVASRARRFAKWSAIGALALGAAGQVAYHLMVAAEITSAPWPITAALSCIPVAVLGMGAGLFHLIRDDNDSAPV
jgi:hypothetical protein